LRDPKNIYMGRELG